MDSLLWMSSQSDCAGGINSPCCMPPSLPLGSESLVHQPQHRYWKERPMAHRRGPGGLSVCNLTARSSDRSPQLLQECLQVGNGSLTQKIRWIKFILHRDLGGVVDLFLSFAEVKSSHVAIKKIHISKNPLFERSTLCCYLMQRHLLSQPWNENTVPVPLSRLQAVKYFYLHHFTPTNRTDWHVSDQRTYRCMLIWHVNCTCMAEHAICSLLKQWVISE